MSTIPQVKGSEVTTDLPIVTTTEIVAATLSGINVGAGGVVIVTGTAAVTLGTSTTGLTLRIRRGTAITDPVVGEAYVGSDPVATLASVIRSITAVDAITAELANASYVLTVQQVAAGANGTVLTAAVAAIAQG